MGTGQSDNGSVQHAFIHDYNDKNYNNQLKFVRDTVLYHVIQPILLCMAYVPLFSSVTSEPVVPLGWVTPGAATEGVTPLFFPEKPGDLF